MRKADNQYIFGSFDPNDPDPQSTIDAEDGFTGELETLLLLYSDQEY